MKFRQLEVCDFEYTVDDLLRKKQSQLIGLRY